MKRVAEQISGYTYGDAGVSSVSLRDLENLKISVGWTEEDERYRHLAGEVLADQTKPLVDRWRREIIASIPNLIRHSRTPDGEPLPDYQTKSGLPFEQWVLDTYFRPYNQDWLTRRTTWKNASGLDEVSPIAGRTLGSALFES